MKKTLISLVTLASIGLAAKLYLSNKKPTAEEFFASNPHLKRAPLKTHNLEEIQRRKETEFQRGDYYFHPGLQIEVKFSTTIGLDLKPEDKTLSRSSNGTLNLRSLGFHDGLLYLWSEPNYENLSFSPDSIGASLKRLQNKTLTKNDLALLFSIDPTGKIAQVFSSSKLTKEEVAIHFNIIDQALRPLPKTFDEVGTHPTKEKDSTGRDYQITYTVSRPAPDTLKIKADHEASSTLGSPSQSAAAGVSMLDGLSLRVSQAQGLEWLWDSKLNLPRSQKLSAEAKVEQGSSLVSRQFSSAQLDWTISPEKMLAPEFAQLKPLLPKAWSPRELDDALSFSTETDPSKAQNRTRRNLLAKIGSIKGATATEQESYFIELFKALDQDPTLIAEYKSEFLKLGPGDRGRNMLLGALGFEGSVESQAAMLELYRSQDATADERLKIMQELALLGHPLSVEAKSFLQQEYAKNTDPDLSSSAMMALGSSISKDGDPKTISFISSEWKKAPPTDTGIRKKEVLLLGMGNSKSDAFESEVDAALGTGIKTLRSAATNSLRFAQQEDLREKLTELTLEDEDADIRATGAASFRYQPKDDLTHRTLLSCVSDKEAQVRANCYRTISVYQEDPKYRTLLEGAVSSESDPQLKETLGTLLNGDVEGN